MAISDRRPTRRAARALAAVALLLPLTGCRPERSPDVVVVLVDTLRADRLGVAGYPLPATPAIDAVARDGVHFTRAYSASTWTKPAIASLFTALHPSEHGIRRQLRETGHKVRSQRLPESLPTLAERFRAGGWTTLGTVRQVNLREKYGFSRGFDHWEMPRGADAFAMVDAFLAGLDRLGRAKPVFGYLHVIDVHWPYDERLPDLAEDAFGPIGPEDRGHVEREAIQAARREKFAGFDVAALAAAYDHGVAFTDRAIRRLVEGLHERGRWKDTIFVVTSDHGEGFLEHGRLEHTFAPYDEVARIPLVIHLPAGAAVTPGARRSIVSLTDLGPTLLELAGLPPWEGVSGRSFAGVVAGSEDDGRSAWIESEDARALRRGDTKVMRRWRRVHFWDLAADPAERHDLAAGGCEGPCAEEHRRLQAFAHALRPPPKDAGAAAAAADEVEELRALGYL